MAAYIVALGGLVTGIPIIALCADYMFGLLNRCVAFFARLPLSSVRVARFPIWLTLLIGVVAALVGTFLAAAIGVDKTDGVDWIELILQIGLAAVGVAAISAVRSRSR